PHPGRQRRPDRRRARRPPVPEPRSSPPGQERRISAAGLAARPSHEGLFALRYCMPMTAIDHAHHTVHVREDGGIATITLNRPDKLNAISTQLSVELAESIRRAAADSTVRAVVITGAGRAFCAGGDIDGIRSLLEGPDLSASRTILEAGAS